MLSVKTELNVWSCYDRITIPKPLSGYIIYIPSTHPWLRHNKSMFYMIKYHIASGHIG